MTGRHSLLAELEARRQQTTEGSVEVLSAELRPNTEDAGYDPYDNPGLAKTVAEPGRAASLQSRRRLLKKRR
jgi:hypothetical protein